MASAESNIGKFYLCAALGGLTFFHGILGFYLRQVGFSYAQTFSIAKVGTGLAEPILSDLVARNSPQGMLATIMSTQNLLMSLTFAAWSLLLGVGLDHAGPLPAFLVSAVLLAAALGLLGARLRRT
jgi:hypothetical protein